MPLDFNMKVLIVDDYKTMIRINRNLLGHIGFTNFVEAYSAEGAAKALNTDDIGLMVTDHMSDEPVIGMTGCDLVSYMRGSTKYAHIPVIMVTQSNNVAHLDKLMACGPEEVMIKPYNAASLKRRIANIFGKF